MEQFLAENFPYIFLIYVVIYHGVIPIAKAVVEQYLPVKVSKMKSAEERQIEIEEKRADLREREVVAMEQIGKTMAIIETNQRHMGTNLQTIASSVNLGNQALMTLLDRQENRRKTDPPTTQE